MTETTRTSEGEGRHAPWRSRHIVAQVPWSLFMVLPLLIVSPALRAHDIFTSFIQHRVAVVAGAKHLDVTVQLTFFEEGSQHEREHIDANDDGRLTRSEIDSYLQDLESRLTNAVRLTAGGRSVPLAVLRSPELDLLGNDRTGSGHLRLALYYFAPLPTGMRPGTELVVEDRLWPHVRALGSIQVHGKDGCRLEPLPDDDPLYPPARQDEPRRFRARVLVPPLATHAGKPPTEKS